MTQSNEVESLAEVLRMIGGNDDYISAVTVAGFVQTFKNSLNVCVWTDKDGKYIEVDIWKIDIGEGDQFKPLIQLNVPKKYEYLFKEK